MTESTTPVVPRHRKPRRALTAAIAGALITGALLVQTALPAGVLAGPVPGNLDHYVVGPGAATAGTPFGLSIQARDQMNRAIKTMDSPVCLVFSGAPNSPNGIYAPSYPPQGLCASGQSSVSFTDGSASAPLTLVAAGLTSITVYDPSVPRTDSGSVTVSPATVASLYFQDSATNFNGQPIDTKTDTPIYHTCLPDPTGTKPCASPSQTPASTPVQVLGKDLYGNLVNTTSVTISGVDHTQSQNR